MNDNFNHLGGAAEGAETAIEAACALKSMVVGYDVNPAELRMQYSGARDEDILRIVDTLHIYRYDWMTNAKQSLQELCAHTPKKLHSTILDEAQDIAFERLKHIGFLQISGEYLDIMEHDKICEGQDRFPELFDASKDAENQTREAIDDIAILRKEMFCPHPANDRQNTQNSAHKANGPK